MARPIVHGFTIDGAGSKDLDDALWVEEAPAGLRITVAIADVADEVGKGDVLDRSAARRMGTRYKQGGNTPMLPLSLSEGALSILAGKSRDVVAVSVTLTPEGGTRDLEIQEARLISRAQLTHEETDRILAGKDHPLRNALLRCQHVANVLLTKRRAKGACVVYDIQRGIYADEDGVIRRFSGSVHAQIIVQEFMILANSQVATWMVTAGRRMIFRNHQARPAAPGREELLRQFDSAIQHPALLAGLQERMVLWMERARYAPTVLGHFALNLPAYCHFTSPIRRYADLVNHRMVKAALLRQPEPYAESELTSISDSINAWRDAEADALSEALKSRAIQERRASLGLSVEKLVLLDGQTFSQVIEQATKDGPPCADLVEALSRRACLAPADFWHIFFRGDASWMDVRSKSIDLIKKTPGTSLMVVEIARQKSGLAADMEVIPFGGQFNARLVVESKDGPMVAPGNWVTEPRKKAAMSHAATAYLEALTGPGLIPLPCVVTTDQVVVPGVVDGGNFIGLLNEWAQRNHYLSPWFTVDSEGPSHCPTFRATVTLHLNEGAIQAEGGPAKSKQEARRLAAQALYLRLPVMPG